MSGDLREPSPASDVGKAPVERESDGDDDQADLQDLPLSLEVPLPIHARIVAPAKGVRPRASVLRRGVCATIRAMRSLAVLLTLLAAGLAWAADVYKVGDVVDDATLAMADGTETKLSSNDGNVVILFFYGTWEKHADDHAAQIDTIRKARLKQKLTVLGVARDAKAADAKKFAEDHKIEFPQAVDAKSEFYGKFATKGLPYVVILDGERKLKHSAAGIDEDAIETVLTDLLGAKDPVPEKKKDAADAEGGGKK